MNEPQSQEPVQTMSDATDGKSAGTLLREAREAAGLHVSALAVSLKVPVKKLEALEADDLEQLPDAVFARALAATVCRTLKVDPEPVLARLPQLHRPPLQVGTQETPVRLDNHGGGMRPRSIGGLPRPVVYLSALLLVGALVVALLPSLRIGGEPPAAQSPDGTSLRAVPHQLSETTVIPAATGEAATAGSDAMVAAPAAMASSDTAAASAAASATPPSAANTPVALAAAGPAAAAPVAAAAGGALAIFSTRESTWVQVVDAAGLVHLRKTMDAGETVSINGSLPLSVVIGRASAVDLVVRGKPFDVRAVAKDNVARFQIK